MANCWQAVVMCIHCLQQQLLSASTMRRTACADNTLFQGFMIVIAGEVEYEKMNILCSPLIPLPNKRLIMQTVCYTTQQLTFHWSDGCINACMPVVGGVLAVVFGFQFHETWWFPPYLAAYLFVKCLFEDGYLEGIDLRLWWLPVVIDWFNLAGSLFLST